MSRIIFTTFLSAMLVLLAACASTVPLAEPEAEQTITRPISSSSQASLPATAVEASVSGKALLGRLGFSSEAPAGMCWVDLSANGAFSGLVKSLTANLPASLVPLALAVNCDQAQGWQQNNSGIPTSYMLIVQKMNERVGGGGANQARERWMMVQGLGGNFGFYPQDQYTKLSYITNEAAKLAPGERRQLGEVRRDEMALYTVEVGRRGENAPQFILTQYSQLRGTPVALLWNKPVSRVDSLSAQILGASAYLAGLVRQSDDPRLSGTPVAPVVDTAPTPVTPGGAAASSAGAVAGNAAGQTAGEDLIAPTPGASTQVIDISGWEKAKFGMTPAELRQHYQLVNPSREDLRGRAFYLDGRNEVIAGLNFRVLFDFSDSSAGAPQHLGRIIFTSTSTGGNVASQKDVLVKALIDRYGQPTSDTQADGGPITWSRKSGKATMQMITSNNNTVWLIVLEAQKF